MNNFFLYLAVMAGVTYLIRMLPLVLMRRKLQNRFLLSFLYYIPYAVLSVMTIPAIFYAVGNWHAAVAGFAVAVILAFFNRSLVKVAAFSCIAVLAVELLEKF
ncbi:MAG: branched-chain amino acid transporter [Clostridiales bacterium]|nr:branched-chain amino acid transporter [Clostridiales bacterium]